MIKQSITQLCVSVSGKSYCTLAREYAVPVKRGRAYDKCPRSLRDAVMSSAAWLTAQTLGRAFDGDLQMPAHMRCRDDMRETLLYRLRRKRCRRRTEPAAGRCIALTSSTAHAVV